MVRDVIMSKITKLDDIYNWLVQLLYVYDTGFQFVEGAEPPRLSISVKFSKFPA